MNRLRWVLVFAVALLVAMIFYRGCKIVPPVAPPPTPVPTLGGIICGKPGAPLQFNIWEGCRCRCTGACPTDPNMPQYACQPDATCTGPDPLPPQWCGAIFTCNP